MEDLLYKSESVRHCRGLKLNGPIPDEPTILHFRHLLERHQLGGALLKTINAHLASQGLRPFAGKTFSDPHGRQLIDVRSHHLRDLVQRVAVRQRCEHLPAH